MCARQKYGHMSGNLDTENLGTMCMYTRNGKQFFRKAKSPDKGEVSPAKRMITMANTNLNVIHKVFKPLVDDTMFPTNKEQRMGWFRKENAKYCHFALLPEEIDKGGCIVNTFVVSKGTLKKIEIDEWGTSSIELPGIEKLERFMSVGEVSKAILEGNEDWRPGDVLAFVRARQVWTMEDVPTIDGAVLKMTIDVEDSCLLGEVWPVDSMDVTDGRMAYSGGNEAVGYCWVHLRPSEHGKDFGVEDYADASTQQLKVVNCKEIQAKYRSKEQIERAMEAWEKRREERKEKQETRKKTKTVEDMLEGGW